MNADMFKIDIPQLQLSPGQHIVLESKFPHRIPRLHVVSNMTEAKNLVIRMMKMFTTKTKNYVI